MIDLIQIATDRDSIMAVIKVYCPVCNDGLFSGFHKLYIKAFGLCYSCDDLSDSKEAETRSMQILEIIQN